MIISVYCVQDVFAKNSQKAYGKIYTSTCVMESVRQGQKVKHHIVVNLSKLPENVIRAVEAALKGKEISNLDDLNLTQGKSVGAIYTVKEIARRLGITLALGNSQKGMLALFQIAGRIIAQGSRNYLANEWSRGQAIEKVFKIRNLSEDELYENLDWLSRNQEANI